MCEVEYTDLFELWWQELTEAEQISITAVVGLLENLGTKLGYPYSSGIHESKHSHMRELRIQHAGSPYRILYAFDPRRAAILLLGGNKRGDKHWYEPAIREADSLYDEHITTLKKEGLIHG